MSDETTPLIFGDTAVAELGRHPGRKWFGRKRKSRPPLTHCENCGAALTGPYCAQCGQPAVDYRRSFGSLLADAAAHFSISMRLFQSFGLLLFKPWRLTKIRGGKRARHSSLRVIIASVLFLVINFLFQRQHLEATQARLIIFRSLRPRLPGALGLDSMLIFVRNVTLPSPTAAPHRQDHTFLQFDDDETSRPVAGWRSVGKIGPTGDRGDLFLKAIIKSCADGLCHPALRSS